MGEKLVALKEEKARPYQDLKNLELFLTIKKVA
jgi:hypothetical protein